jgi:hypothetical protein
VITGFNTDVEYQGVVYHVQTEDKGVETPLILSLVYNRGTILASKRSPYDDLISGGFDEKILAARLQKQHKTICAAVSAGRFEDLKRMAAKDSAARQKETPAAPPMQKPLPQSIESSAKTAPSQINLFSPKADLYKTENFDPNKKQASPVEKSEIPKPSFFEKPLNKETFAEKIDRAKAETNKPTFAKPLVPDSPPKAKTAPPRHSANLQAASSNAEQRISSIPKPRHELGVHVGINAYEKEVIIEAVEVIGDEMILPAEAVAIVADFAAPIPKNDPLKIEFLVPMPLKSGERKTVSLVVCRGKQENGVSAAQIMVKILGSSFRPLIFHAKTDMKGVATVHLQLPHFRTGRAALLVRAMHSGEQVELRRAILHG